ncbi:TlpA family protein disulfide reductase [Halalkalibacter kiskunsagensis]|uniref:TlpA family protein disulfide reductase n=1 Tax=Halalkalibacter kiskunsagensis TaxID=1548599 RepID=A0ABV6KN72_9BACI
MDGVWMLGPIIIKQTWLMTVLLLVVGFYLSSQLVKEVDNQARPFSELYWNSVFYFFIVFQLSTLIVNPMISVKDPLAVLAMPSGMKEWLIAWGYLFVYLFWKTKREWTVRIKLLIHILVSYLVIETVYFAFNQFISNGYPVSIVQMILNIGLLILFFNQKQKQVDAHLLLCRLVFLYGAIMGILSIVIQVRMLEMAVPSWYYFILVFVSLVSLNRKRRTEDIVRRNDKKGIVVIGILVLLLGWSSMSFVMNGDEGKETSLSSSVAIGNIAPDFSLPTLEGNEMSLSDFKGKPIMINFWATWCPPCRAELPDMQRFYTNHDIVLLAVNGTNTESSKAHVDDFVGKMGLSFPVLTDLNGEVASLYQVRPLPTSLFIDETGTIRDIHVGPLNQERMIRQLEQMVESK